MVYIANIHEAS